MSKRHSITIGVCGGSGSGKSTLADYLQQRLMADTVVLRQDCYYRDCSHLSADARTQVNFDHPTAIDLKQFSLDLRCLRAGQRIHPPQYCFHTHRRDRDKKPLGPAKVIIVEGLFLFQEPSLNVLYDLKVFIHADNDLRLLRRMQRDVEQRGRTLNSVSRQYLETVKPMHDQYVEPNRQLADLVIDPTNLEQLAHCAGTLAARVSQLTAKPDC